MRHHSSVARREGPPYLLELRRILAYAGCVAVNSVKYALHRLTSLPTGIRGVSKQTSMFGRVSSNTCIQLSSGPKVSACLIGTSNHKRRFLRAKPDKDELPGPEECNNTS